MSHTTYLLNGYDVPVYRCDVCQSAERVVPDEDVYATSLHAFLVLDVCRDCLEGAAEQFVNDYYGEPTAEPRSLCGFCLERHADACAGLREEEQAEAFDRATAKDYGRVA